MNTFQYVTIGVLTGVLAVEVVRGLRSSDPRGAWVVRCLVWIAALAAVAFPELVQTIAVLLGIGRGADVLLYLFVLLFVAATFFLYARSRRQQQHITELVRHLALLEARQRRGPGHADSENGTTRRPSLS